MKTLRYTNRHGIALAILTEIIGKNGAYSVHLPQADVVVEDGNRDAMTEENLWEKCHSFKEGRKAFSCPAFFYRIKGKYVRFSGDHGSSGEVEAKMRIFCVDEKWHLHYVLLVLRPDVGGPTLIGAGMFQAFIFAEEWARKAHHADGIIFNPYGTLRDNSIIPHGNEKPRFMQRCRELLDFLMWK